jgi:hypothetical protein
VTIPTRRITDAGRTKAADPDLLVLIEEAAPIGVCAAFGHGLKLRSPAQAPSALRPASAIADAFKGAARLSQISGGTAGKRNIPTSFSAYTRSALLPLLPVERWAAWGALCAGSSSQQLPTLGLRRGRSGNPLRSKPLYGSCNT